MNASLEGTTEKNGPLFSRRRIWSLWIRWAERWGGEERTDPFIWKVGESAHDGHSWLLKGDDVYEGSFSSADAMGVIGLDLVVVVQLLSHVRLCDPTDCSMSGFSVLHYLLEFAQTHVHWVSDAIQPSHPLSSPSAPSFNLSQLDFWMGQGEIFVFYRIKYNLEPWGRGEMAWESVRTLRRANVSWMLCEAGVLTGEKLPGWRDWNDF